MAGNDKRNQVFPFSVHTKEFSPKTWEFKIISHIKMHAHTKKIEKTEWRTYSRKQLHNSDISNAK